MGSWYLLKAFFLENGVANEGHESDEGHEGDEGHEVWCREVWSHDCLWCICFCCREGRFEAEGRQGCGRRPLGGCGSPAEEKRIFQDRWCFESEVEVETSYASSKGREPFYERAMRFQSEACI